MKIIGATMHISRDTLLSSSFDVKSAVEKEILVRLREVYEADLGHSVGEIVWDILKGNTVEYSTTLLENDVWQFKAQMVVPEEIELFKVEK